MHFFTNCGISTAKSAERMANSCQNCTTNKGGDAIVEREGYHNNCKKNEERGCWIIFCIGIGWDEVNVLLRNNRICYLAAAHSAQICTRAQFACAGASCKCMHVYFAILFVYHYAKHLAFVECFTKKQIWKNSLDKSQNSGCDSEWVCLCVCAVCMHWKVKLKCYLSSSRI